MPQLPEPDATLLERAPELIARLEAVVPGGVIVADDYGTTTCQGVKKAVDEFGASNPGFRIFHLLTGQAVVTKLGL